MSAETPNAQKTDQFIATFPPEVQAILQQMRSLIQQAAPEATETFGYGVPGFALQGNLVYYSAFTNHVGFYPGAEAIEVFQQELAPYGTAKGTVRFPLDQPLPVDLIRRMVAFRVEKNLAQAAAKKKKAK